MIGPSLPGRMPNHRNLDIILLPSDFSKRFVYRKYMEASVQLDHYYFSRRHCGVNSVPTLPTLSGHASNSMTKFQNRFPSPRVREELRHSAADHLKHARTEHHNYRQQCNEATEQLKEHCEKHPFEG